MTVKHPNSFRYIVTDGYYAKILTMDKRRKKNTILGSIEFKLTIINKSNLIRIAKCFDAVIIVRVKYKENNKTGKAIKQRIRTFGIEGY